MKQQPRKEFQMIYTKEIIMSCIERYIYKAILRQPKCKNKISPKIRDWLNNIHYSQAMQERSSTDDVAERAERCTVRKSVWNYLL